MFVIRKISVTVWLLALALFGSQFNYLILSLLFPGDDERYIATGISPEVFFGIIFIGGTFFLYLTDKGNLGTSHRKPSTAFIMLISTFITIFFSIIYNEIGFRPLITLLACVLFFWSARYLSSKCADIISYQLKKWLLVIPPLFMILLVYFFVTDRIDFLSESGIEFLRPQIMGGIRSTEVAIFVGLQSIYLIYCFGISQNKIEKGLIFTLMIGLFSLLIFLFSVGAILGLVLAYLFYFLLIPKNKIRKMCKLVFVVFIIGLAGILLLKESTIFLFEFLKNVLEFKLYDLVESTGSRNMKYSLLWTMIIDNPVFGIGWGNFVKSNTLDWTGTGSYPHNNLLGIAAENGIISALLYLSFVFFTIILGIKTFIKNGHLLNRGKNQAIKYFLFMAIGCFIFLQWRGLFQDTWQIKEIYFWAGIIVGTSEWLQANGNKKFEIYQNS